MAKSSEESSGYLIRGGPFKFGLDSKDSAVADIVNTARVVVGVGGRLRRTFGFCRFPYPSDASFSTGHAYGERCIGGQQQPDTA